MCEKKDKVLGMPYGTASNRLHKQILYSLAAKCNQNICCRCNKPIEVSTELSIEHKTAWLNAENPLEAFFDLDNIAFSHLSCNCKAARKVNKKNRTQEEMREVWRTNAKRRYTTDKRRKKFLRSGY